MLWLFLDTSPVLIHQLVYHCSTSALLITGSRKSRARDSVIAPPLQRFKIFWLSCVCVSQIMQAPPSFLSAYGCHATLSYSGILLCAVCLSSDH